MANYLVTDTDLTVIANAIRTKGGTSGSLMFPNGFVDAIDAIETGGGGLVLLREIATTEDVNAFQTTIDSEILSYDFALVFMDFTLSASDWLYMGINNTQYYSISKVKWRLALPIISNDAVKRFQIPATSDTFAGPAVSDGDQFMCKCYVSTNTILSGSSLKFYGGNYADF